MFSYSYIAQKMQQWKCLLRQDLIACGVGLLYLFFFSEGFYKSVGANCWICARMLMDLLPLSCFQQIRHLFLADQEQCFPGACFQGSGAVLKGP